jgi:hypothetical protein
MERERGQGTVEWIGLLLAVAMVMLGLLAAGVRVPGATMARALADRILCAASSADGCGDEPTLIAAYGSEVGKLVREHMPSLVFEQGSRAVPVDFRHCRSTACADGPEDGLVHRTDEGLPVTAFVHVVDCRAEAAEESEAGGADCSGKRAGNLYVQYWTYYANSATLRGVPVVGPKGYHHDDWEGVQLRFGLDGRVDERASSHNGYNSEPQGPSNWGSDIGSAVGKGVVELVGARGENGWGEETHLLFVSGGSHAGNTMDVVDIDRYTPGRRVHLVPLEDIAAAGAASFAVSPPWLKDVWLDPEAGGTS